MVTCEHCGRQTPDETFCTYCGAHRARGAGEVPRRRMAAYAAHPGEHVLAPNLLSTLLPHLPSHRLHEFRWGLLAGVAAVVALTAAGAVVPGTFVAAVLVPVLYLVYLVEAQVYKAEPVRTLGLTVVAGALLGTASMLIASVFIPSSTPLQLGGATATVIGGTILLPIAQELVKPAPALLLRWRPQFRETIDGLVFGVAIGLGFAAASTIFDFSRIIAYEPLHTSARSWLFPLLSAAVLTPVMQASCTGLVTASLWRRIPDASQRRLLVAGIPVALGCHVAFTWISWVLARHGTGPATVLAWQAAVDVVLLLYIRVLLHGALRDEAGELGLSSIVCPHCRRHEMVAAFCPHCGAATSAAPRTPGGGLRSDPRPDEETPAP
jgi:RsiW-degrading membrane proteinase PrsW (M82 family)